MRSNLTVEAWEYEQIAKTNACREMLWEFGEERRHCSKKGSGVDGSLRGGACTYALCVVHLDNDIGDIPWSRMYDFIPVYKCTLTCIAASLREVRSELSTWHLASVQLDR